MFSHCKEEHHMESEGFWNCWTCFAARLRRLTWIIEVFTEKLSLMDIRTLKSSLTPGLYYHPFILLQILFNLLSFRTFFGLWRHSLLKHNLEGFLVSRVLSIVNQNVKRLVGKLSVYILSSNYPTGCLMRENIFYAFHKSDLIKNFWIDRMRRAADTATPGPFSWPSWPSWAVRSLHFYPSQPSESSSAARETSSGLFRAWTGSVFVF